MSNDQKKTVMQWAFTPQKPQSPAPWNGPPVYPQQQQHPQQHGYYPPQQHDQLPAYLQPGYPPLDGQPYQVQPQPHGSGIGYQPLLPPAPAKPAKNAKAAKPQKPQKPQPQKPQRPIANADATAGSSQRLRFIRLTYVHLLFAIGAFAGLLYLLMTVPVLVDKVSIPLVRFALGGRWNWGIVLGAFMAVSWIADAWARNATSRGVQYAGLGFYIIAEALIFVPLLAIVQWKTAAIIARGGGDPNIIRDSAYVTLGIFTALTLSVFLTRKDFSYLKSGLVMATGAAMTAIVLSLTFGFNLGLVFSVGMVLLAAAYILYQTSQVLAHYDPNQHVAASLALFSSVALMFWYVIRIFTRARE